MYASGGVMGPMPALFVLLRNCHAGVQSSHTILSFQSQQSRRGVASSTALGGRECRSPDRIIPVGWEQGGPVRGYTDPSGEGCAPSIVAGRILHEVETSAPCKLRPPHPSPTAHSAGSRGPGTAELGSNWAWTCHTGQACDHGSQLLPWALAPWLSPRGHP